MVGVARVEHNHVVGSLLGDRRQDRLGQIAVGIDQTHALSGANIGCDKMVQQDREDARETIVRVPV